MTVALTPFAPRAGGVACTNYQIDSGPEEAGTLATVAAPPDHSNDGVHTVNYWSTDLLGNVETIKSCQVMIDTRQPVTAALRSVSVRRNAYATLGYRVNDARPNGGTAIVTLRITTLRGRLVKSVVLRNRTVNTPHAYRFRCALARGTYKFCVYATDLAGNKQAVVGSKRLVVWAA